jgi:D-xylonolactonase
MAYQLAVDESVGEGLRRLAAEQLDKALGHLESQTGERDEHVHEARKCLKRLRALVQLGRFALGSEVYRRENDCYRDVGLQLASMRDATVLLETLECLTATAVPRIRRDRFATVRRWLEERRQAAYGDGAADPAPPVVSQLRWARLRVDDWPAEVSGWHALEQGLTLVYDRGRNSLAQARSEPRDEHYHEWRKWAKYLWYHTQLLAATWPPVAAAVAGELDELGEVLGQDHDLSVLRHAVEHELSRPIRAVTLQALLALIEARQHELRQRARGIGARVYTERPRSFARRQRGYWQAWRERREPEPEMAAEEKAGEGGERMEPIQIADFACHTGEGPLWHRQEKRLYWVDIPAGRLFRHDPETGRSSICYQGEAIGGFTVQADGSLLLFMARGAVAVWREGRPLETVVPEIPAERGSRFNDVIADPEGRVYCGTMPTGEEPGRLYRLDRDGSLTVILEGVGCSNGLAFTLDHRAVYYTDSARRVIYLFDYDRASGSLTNQRVFLDTGSEEGVPDGMTVDSEGYIWSARWDGGCVVRYTPDGREERRVSLPARKVSSVTFGGRDWSRLYLTTAGGDDREHEGPGAGALFRFDPGVRGVPEFLSRVGL